MTTTVDVGLVTYLPHATRVPRFLLYETVPPWNFGGNRYRIYMGPRWDNLTDPAPTRVSSRFYESHLLYSAYRFF